MTPPPSLTVAHLTEVEDPVERARVLARAAHAGQEDKARVDYFAGHLTDVWRRAVAYGADSDEQAAALLHDVVEDTEVPEEDLWRCGFSDQTILIVHLMTKRPREPVDVYYARLRAFEPARRLKCDADVASNSDPEPLALVEEPKRTRLVEKYATAARALAPATTVPTDRPMLALLPKDDQFAAVNALRALGGIEPLPHEANTLAEKRGDRLAWFVECSCGWRGPDRDDEYTADFDLLDHTEAGR